MDPFIGEIRLFGFPRAPNNWVFCDGGSLSIGQYGALYALIGTTYGGDGVSTFRVPDLRGRVPIGYGTGPGLPTYALGQIGGAETHTLVAGEMPSHGHPLTSTVNVGTAAGPAPNLHFATAEPASRGLYAPVGAVSSYTAMAPQVEPAGGNAPHGNIMPSLVMNYCICVEGIFPSGG